MTRTSCAQSGRYIGIRIRLHNCKSLWAVQGIGIPSSAIVCDRTRYTECAHAYEVYGWSSFANKGPMCGQATTSKKSRFTQLNCTCRVWGYCSKASLKDFQQSNVPTFKTGSSISNNCTDHLRFIMIRCILKKHIRPHQFLPPQRKQRSMQRQGGLLPMREERYLNGHWSIHLIGRAVIGQSLLCE